MPQRNDYFDIQGQSNNRRTYRKSVFKAYAHDEVPDLPTRICPLKNIPHSMGLCKVKNVMRLCGCSGVFCIRTRGDTLRKHAYSNMLKILPPKIEKFQRENSDIFHISAQNIEI